MLGGFGAMLGEPAALRLRQRSSAQRIFAGEPTAIEKRFKVDQRASLALVANTHREMACQAHDEPQAVLKITHFCFPHDPTPIESRIPQHEPGECFDEPRLEVILYEGSEKNLTGVLRRPVVRAQVREAGVSETSEVPRQCCGVDASWKLSLRTRNDRRREVVKPCGVCDCNQ